MVDMGAIAGLVGSLQAAGELTKTVIGLRDGQMIQAKVIELQSVILSAQSSALTAQQDQFTMLQRVRSLEQQIADLEKWDGEAEQYELKQIDVGAFAYMKKADASVSTPPHWLCVNCFEHRKKSILQYKERTKDTRSSVWSCPQCKSAVITHWNRKPGDPFPPS